MNLNEYIRRCVEQRALTTVQPEVNRITALELGRIGVNLNQQVRAMNTAIASGQYIPMCPRRWVLLKRFTRWSRNFNRNCWAQMIGKTVKGNGFRGVLNYVMQKPGAECIGGNMCATTAIGLALEFRAIASHNQRVKKPVAHISLSPSPLEELSDSLALDFARAYMDKIGFRNCQWVLVDIPTLKPEMAYPAPTFISLLTGYSFLIISCYRLEGLQAL
jgi:hypothetical protein